MEMKIHRRGSQNKLLVLRKHELICYAVLLACLAGLAHSAENEKCPNTPQCICKWSGGKRMADCSNAGNNFIPLVVSIGLFWFYFMFFSYSGVYFLRVYFNCMLGQYQGRNIFKR